MSSSRQWMSVSTGGGQLGTPGGHGTTEIEDPLSTALLTPPGRKKCRKSPPLRTGRARQYCAYMASLPAPLENLISYVRSLRPDGDPLDHLSDAVVTAQELSDQGDALIGHFVDQARGSGASWSQIGTAMGVSKQAAQKRFTARDEPLLPEGKAFSRFTPRARSAVAAAGRLADAGGADAMDTTHLASAAVLDPVGLAARAISRLDVSSRRVFDALGVGTPTPGPDPDPTELRGLHYTTECREAFKNSLKAAVRLGHNYIGTEHLLLGALSLDGPARQAFDRLGLPAHLIESAIAVEIAEATLQERRQAG